MVSNKKPAIEVDGLSFALNGKNVSYRFHVDAESGDLISDHFGGHVDENPITQIPRLQGWSNLGHLRREFPDAGRGDFRTPAVVVKQASGHTVSEFRYHSHRISNSRKLKPSDLPSTFAGEGEAETLVITLQDSQALIKVEICYSVFSEYDAITRWVSVDNDSDETITIEKLASFSVDLPFEEYEMVQLRGEWARECTKDRRKVDYGIQGFGSNAGYSSHFHSPFFSIVSPSTTESHGEAWGFSLVYSGSFIAEVEKSPKGLTRAMIGLNPTQLSWEVKPWATFETPECVSVYSGEGLGHMSRQFHRLYRSHLITSKFFNEPRPVLLNSWEGLVFDFDENTILNLARESADLGVKLFVLDDGWFGVKYPRVNDRAGLGDWEANPARFPDGLEPMVERITKMKSKGSDKNLQFGLWFEPEMVNPKSKLYEEHPDWVLHAGDYPRTETRQQLVLNLALKEVQEYITESVGKILKSAPVSYVKWDNNRGMHECPSPATHHAYMLGLYHVLDELTQLFPDVLWEGCASGGGRFDPGILYYFPQVWTSDNTDALDRIHIQFGASLVYPPSTMGAHVSAVPNGITRRTTSIQFRAHVAMMGGSFGLELDPAVMPDDEKKQIPELIGLAEKINSIIVRGDMWRLNLPEESNYPAALFISENGSQAVLFVFQMKATVAHLTPMIRLQGLDPSATYKVDGGQTSSGATLMNGGMQFILEGDCSSKVVFLDKV
ncbi:Melibiase-domain-containing protein [Thelonectria olida]|uniref:Alpha-galactosidase n=1 Tax=Thelonectria olida TaxID=1576542 RepID=A0A9P9ASS5_9HYPO|nr:Melibiase-domain-containing protein [Thelonectria olida]